jgi:hypothetical protein
MKTLVNPQSAHKVEKRVATPTAIQPKATAFFIAGLLLAAGYPCVFAI